jgi:hypothetical protein
MAKGGFRINIDAKEFTKKLRSLQSIWGLKSLTKEAAAVAQELITKTVEAPVPSDTGELAGSGAVEANLSRGIVRFGFNKVYANFQDGDGRSIQVIRPKRKRALYVPITEKGRRRHRIGRNPLNEGLVFNQDYTLKKSVRVSIKPYGSPIGPNQYFTGTLSRNRDFFFEQLVIRMDRLAEEKK